MTTAYTLFTETPAYYARLNATLAQAQQRISMTYLTFDDGVSARQIAAVLYAKAAAGVQVRLMVDAIGLATDNPRNLRRNRALLNGLRQAGVSVTCFNPAGHGLSLLNRLHCKFCAIDQHDLLLGGSNIGDDYLNWSDTNLHLQGNFGGAFHDLYSYLLSFSRPSALPAFDAENILAGGVQVRLTLPGRHSGIRQSLLALIRNARRTLSIRTWYFLPDEEILQALQDKAASGVQVRIMLSHQTRVPLVDQANYLPAHRLALAGAEIYRFAGQYMHAKLAWNDQGQVLLGSANLDACSLGSNFENCLLLHNPALAAELKRAFENDLGHCLRQTAAVHPRRPLSGKLLSHACGLAGAWL